MSVLRFFSSYIPKPDKNIALVRSIFEIQLDIDTNSNENDVIEGYPVSKPLNSLTKKLIPQMMVDTLNLKYEEHAKIIGEICKKLENKEINEKEKTNFSILAVRSFCSLLFAPPDQIDPDSFGLFLKTLNLATEKFPNQQFVTELFFSAFQKLMINEQVPQIVDFVAELQKSELFYSDKALNFFASHSIVTINLIEAIISKKVTKDFRTISNHFFFTACILNKTKYPDRQALQKLSQSVMKLVEFVRENPVGITMNCAILVLMISCRKHMVFDCSAYMDVLRKMCPHNTLFNVNINEELFHTEELHNFELKFIDDEKYAFDIDTTLPTFKNILEIKESETNPLILFSKETGRQLKNADFETFSHVLLHLLAFIGDEGLNIYAITVIIISQLQDFAKEIGNYIIANYSFDIFFPHALFDPSINSYTTPDSPIINLREQLFEMLEMLLVNEKAVLPIRKSLFQILSLITAQSPLFSDVMVLSVTHLSGIFSSNVPNDSLWDVIFNAMIIQQEHHFAGDELAPKYRAHLFAAVSKIFTFTCAIERACFLKFSTRAGAHFLFEKSSRSLFIFIFQTIISGIATIKKEDVISLLSKVLHELVWYLIPLLKNEEYFDLLMAIIKKLCETIIAHISIMSNIIYRTTVLDDIIATLLNIPPTSNKAPAAICMFLDLLLVVQKASYSVFEKIPFVSLAHVVKNVGVNSRIYAKIVSLISGGSLNFDRIAVPEAIPLLILSTQGTPHFKYVLRDILKFCSNSVSNRCACIAGLVPSLLFDYVSEENFDIILDIFVTISKTSCTHDALIKFFKQFSEIKNKEFNNKIFKCIKKLSEIVNELEEPQHFSMALFCSEDSKISVQEIPANHTADDFMISACILIDSPNCGRNFFEFKSSDDLYFKSCFVENRLEVSYKLSQEEDEKVISFESQLPIQKWFTISLICKHTEPCFILFIGDKQVETVPLEQAPVFPDFVENHFFNVIKGCDDFFSIQVQELAMYVHATNWNLSIKLPEKMNMQAITNWASEQWNKTDQNRMKNNGAKLFCFDVNTPLNMEYFGTPIRFFSNFLKVFEASHFINFIVSLFGQIDFHAPSEEEKQMFFENLTNIVLKFVQKSEVICEQMINGHMYSVISFFFYEGSKQILTTNIWNSFIEQFNSLSSNEKLRNILGKWIIFHSDIWCYAPLEVQCKVYEDWISISENSPEVFNQYVSIQLLLTIFNMMVPTEANLERINAVEKVRPNYNEERTNENLEKIHNSILKLCKLSFAKPGTQDDSDFIYQTLWYCPIQSHILKLLELVSYCISLPWFHFQEFHFSKWVTLFSHPFDPVRTTFMNIFASFIEKEDAITDNIIMGCAINIATNEVEPYSEKNSETSLLVNSCRLALGIKEKVTMSDLLEIDSLLLLNPKFILFAIAQAIVCTQDESDIFLQFLEKVLNVPANISMIANTYPVLSQFMLIYWTATKAPKAVKVISTIATCDNAVYLRQVLDAADTISAICNVNCDDLISQIINESFNILSSKEIDIDLCQPSETLALSLLFHTHVYNHKNVIDFITSFYGSVIEEEERPTKMPPFSDVIKAFKEEKLHSQVFSKRIDENGNWLDWDIAWKIVFFLSEINKKFPHSVYQPLVILISQFFNFNISPSKYAGLVPILEQQIELDNTADDFVQFIGTIIQKIPENSVILPVCNKLNKIYGENWMKDNICVNGFHVFNNYCDQPPTSSLQFCEDVSFILKGIEKIQNKPSSDSIKESLDVRTEEARKHLKTLKETSGRHWRTLWASLAHERSPFYDQERVTLSLHYKRFAMFDKMMRPSLLKRNSRFKPHIEASLKRDAINSQLSESQKGEESYEQNPFFTFPRPSIVSSQPKNDLPEKYLWKAPAEFISLEKTQQGTFAVTLGGYFFFRDEKDMQPIHLPSAKISKILLKYVLQRPTAIEIYTTTRRSYLFNFPEADSHKFVSFLRAATLPANVYIQTLPPQQEIDKYTKKWLQYEISTFEYLMWLNEISGRSMNNIQNYPIFPWILKDYTSEELDLENPDSYRDLSKPIGALNEARLEKLKILKENSIEPNPFLYRNTYSCAFNVLNYLVRLEPFTTIHIEHQDGKFNVPTRLFQSFQESYRIVVDMNENFRELTPEFFYSSEFLRNTDNFDLGKINDVPVSDVILPKWANTPENFIFMHKKALESDYVSQHINEWIDLIWGYKQTGEAADKADNTYDPHLYPDVWQKYQSPEDKDMIETMLRHIGSIPQKLFDAPHPKRTPLNKQQNSFLPIKISDEQVIAIRTIGDSIDKITLFILLGNGNIYIYRTYNSTVSILSREVFNDITGFSIGETDSPINFTFTRESSSELIVVRSNGSLYKYKSKQHIDSISSSCVSAERLITGGNDSILVEWKINEKGELSDPKSIMAHANAITCCAASHNYGIAISCSSDGLLIVSFLSNFSFIRSICLKLRAGFVPQIVHVTEGNGIIVVSAGHPRRAVDGTDFSIYTLNGVHVSSVSLPHRVGPWCVATNNADLDYALIVENHRKIVLCDIYTLKVLGTVFECKERITHIGYHRETDTLTIGDHKGTLYIGTLFSSLPFVI